MISPEKLEALIKTCLDDFYKRRIQKIHQLKLTQFFNRKNPYLFRALGTEKASEIVESELLAFVSSSDETMFGDAFFEPIAKMVSGGVVAPSEGVDIAKETRKRYTAYSVKSGPNWGNSSQVRKQIEDFNSLRSRLYKLHKAFDPVVGHAYGKLNRVPSRTRVFRDVSGQRFWAELTGDSEFYLKLIHLMKDEPQKHKQQYKKEWDAAVNRFSKGFMDMFCFPDGRIDWDKLTRFVSASPDS